MTLTLTQLYSAAIIRQVVRGYSCVAVSCLHRCCKVCKVSVALNKNEISEGLCDLDFTKRGCLDIQMIVQLLYKTTG